MHPHEMAASLPGRSCYSNTKLATPSSDVRVNHCTLALGYHVAGKCKNILPFPFLSSFPGASSGRDPYQTLDFLLCLWFTCQGDVQRRSWCLLCGIDLEMETNNGGYRGLYKKCPYLNTWSVFGGAVWEGISGMALLEEVHYWGGLSELKSSCYFQFGFHACCWRCELQPLGPFLIAPFPCHYELLPLWNYKQKKTLL